MQYASLVFAPFDALPTIHNFEHSYETPLYSIASSDSRWLRYLTSFANTILPSSSIGLSVAPLIIIFDLANLMLIISSGFYTTISRYTFAFTGGLSSSYTVVIIFIIEFRIIILNVERKIEILFSNK